MMHSTRRTALIALGLLALAGPALAADAPDKAGAMSVSIASAIGGQDASVVGSAILSDGTVALAVNFGQGPPKIGPVAQLGKGSGAVVLLEDLGRKVKQITVVAEKVRDLAIDKQDNLYVAAGASGLVKLDKAAARVLWRKGVDGVCARVDVGPEGTAVALRYDKDVESTPGGGWMWVFDATGQPLGKFRGHRNTLDACIDEASKTVIHIGWRQAKAFDGKRTYPVQIAYVMGRSYAGETKYVLYDWSSDRNDANFINKPTNNMADTRGYRCSIGADGKLYCAFESAGGNHIFRYEPQLKDGKWVNAGAKKPGGDKYHEWHNSRAEHKTFVGRYEPATGAYLRGQQFAGRLSSGRTNAVRVKNGAVTAAADGQVYFSGGSGAGLPLSFTPPNTGTYNGGGFLCVLKDDMSGRAFCTRVQAGASGMTVAVRTVGGKRIVVLAGQASKTGESLYQHNPLQKTTPPNSGFFVVMTQP